MASINTNNPLSAAAKAAEYYAVYGPYGTRRRTRSRFAAFSRFLLGASATVLLHCMLGLPLLLGAPHQGTNAWLSRASVRQATGDAMPETSTLILLVDAAITQLAGEAGTASLPNIDLDISGIVSDSLENIEVGPPGELEEESTAGSNQDHGMMALLFERYVAQVKARIERAWMLSGSQSAPLSCTIQIRQDRNFRVQEITLQDCGSEGSEHLKVVHAVQRASPLPPPPRKELFSSALTITLFLDGESTRTNAQQVSSESGTTSATQL